MYKRLNELSFVIGFFFLLVSLILIIGYFFSKQLADKLNLYTGTGLFVFGVIMMLLRSTEHHNDASKQ